MATKWRVKNIGASPVTIDPWGRSPRPLAPGKFFQGLFRDSRLKVMFSNPSLKLKSLEVEEDDDDDDAIPKRKKRRDGDDDTISRRRGIDEAPRKKKKRPV